MDLMDRRRLLLAMANNHDQIADALRQANVLKGLVYSPGYISEYGTAAGQSATNKEVYSNKFSNPFTNKEYMLFIKYPQNTTASVWAAIAYYASDGTFRSRRIIGFGNATNVIVNGDKYYYSDIFPKEYDDGDCIFTFRTYGEADIYCVSVATMFNSILIPSNALENVVA